MYRFTVTILLALSISGCNQTGPGPAFESPGSEASGPLLVPMDVISQAASLPPERILDLCRANTDQDLRVLVSTPIPTRVYGYNSRMDNRERVEGAVELDSLTTAISRLSVVALATENASLERQTIAGLARWADANAFLETRNCVQGGNLDDSCTEWTRDDGQDLSAKKDHSSVQMAIAAIQAGYFSSLADTASQAMPDEHQSITSWLEEFQGRMKRPTNVYFGLQMGWWWPAVNRQWAEGDYGQAQASMRRLIEGLDDLVLADGSMRDRTTRGDRSLWYHNSAINETIHSIEMARAAGVNVPPELENRLHAAVTLFLEALDDYSVLDQWAQQRTNASYIGGTQDWSSTWQNNTWGGSWWHIYPYRYPAHPNSSRLRSLVPTSARSAYTDQEIGLGVGCLYNAAAEARRQQ